MKVRLPPFAQRATRAAIVSVAALSLWSCTTAGNDVSSGVQAYESTANVTSAEAAALAETQSAQGNAAPTSAPEGEQTVAIAVPTPVAGDAPAPVQDEATATQQTSQPSSDKTATAAAAANSGSAAQPVDPATAGDGSIATATAETPPPPKKTGLFAFFGSSKPKSVSTTNRDRDGGGAPPSTTQTKRSAVAKAPAQLALNAAAGAPAELNMAALDVADADDETPQPKSRTAAMGDDDSLPGVRQSALFEIKRRSGLNDDSDVDLYEDAPTVQMASVGGMARGANGLLKQHESVDVACLKPGLVRVLKQIEAKYGRKLVVTSGYRSPSHNRRARGAKNSQHMYCAAADIQVPGVGKWELARYIRSMPGRGGVGTYCHTNSIHVDIGPNRDWNWRCRGRRKG